MIRLALFCSLLAPPAFAAETKEQICRYITDMSFAVNKARLNHVKSTEVASTLAASNPPWWDWDARDMALRQIIHSTYDLKWHQLNKDLSKAKAQQTYEKCVRN